MKPVFAWLLLTGMLSFPAQAAAPPDATTVVLLHGLARSSSSMQQMELALEQAGYRVCNIDYPSRKHSVAELASRYVAPAIAACMRGSNRPVDFVTHSLGGIIVRQLAASGAVPNIGRVVMLGPPNHGSEVVDRLGGWTLFKLINGPAGSELDTSPDSVPNKLGPAKFELGVIAGNRSINWILSLMIPGEDDGKVAVSRTRLEGMRDFVVIGASHPSLMNDAEAIRQTLQFLRLGRFAHDAPQDHHPDRPAMGGES